ncbi:cytochrome c biogenesis protein CcdA [Rhizobium sp. PL01]|uniref:cytochrome c biogenesis protein CcdA n=1 Tax=Rhizobium sp. PL01 TaxID=3085631 RepID=UPI0029813383|nr:cytochrome c biogenesis protein CcdA [Rhizobium sp. PL01]MDW5318406.1 cytochrome c biogenesis protein CcdA [Rhizobium sp. PL01]
MAVIGFSIGLYLTVFRMIGGVIMIGIGTVLMVPTLQSHLASAASPFGNWTEQRYGDFDAGGLKGQFLVGLLLDSVWSPCVGPTLGAASLLAASGKNLGQVAATMLIFGLGANLPLLLLGFLSRDTLLRSRSWLLGAGQGGKVFLGGLLIVVGLLIVSRLDKKAEAVIVSHSPSWLTALTTRF